MRLPVTDAMVSAMRLIVAGLAVAFGTFVFLAICLAVVNIYVSGHGHRTLSEIVVIDHAGSGTHLSLADVIALAASAAAGTLAGWITWPRYR